MTESDTDKEKQSESSQELEAADGEDDGSTADQQSEGDSSESSSEPEAGGLSLPGLDDIDGGDEEESSEAEEEAGDEEDIFSMSVPSVDEVDGAADSDEGTSEEEDEAASAEQVDEEGASENEDTADKPSKPPELPKRPDDVKGARETPDRKLNFRSGEKVGGRFTVQRYLGSSGGGISYLCKHDEAGGRVVIKVLAMAAPEGDQLEFVRQKIRTASQLRHKNLTNILGMGRTDDGKVYVAMDFVEGQALSSVVGDRRDGGAEITLPEVFHVLVHICEGLKAIHEKMVHGVLTPFNVYVSDQGRVQIQNLGFGQLAARALHAKGEGPFHESIYVAPEVTESPAELGPPADMFSLGMMTAELLSGGGLPRDREQAREIAVRLAGEYGNGLARLVKTSLQPNPAKRISSPGEFRMGLESAVKEAGIDPADGLPADAMEIEPAVEVRGGGDDEDADLFDIPGPDESIDQSEEADERYLVRKDGLDYGPFDKEAVLEQLYDDDIDEHTSVLDRTSQERSELGEMEAFRQEVEEYIPKREERRRQEEEKRRKRVETVKKGGKAVLVLGIVAGLIMLTIMSVYYFTRPAPKPLPVGKAFVSLDYKFLPPPKDFQTVAADEDLLESIFNPQAAEEEIAKRVKQARRSSGGGSGGSGGGGTTGSGGGGGDEEVTTVDLSESGGSNHLLTDKEINNIILSNFSALRQCIFKEIDENPSFNGVTVKFYIRPSGTTGGVTLQEKKYVNRPVGECLIQEFRQLKFPAHNAVSNKGVTFPLQIRR